MPHETQESNLDRHSGLCRCGAGSVRADLQAFNGGAKSVAEMSEEERTDYAEKIKTQVGKRLLMTTETPVIIEAAADNLGDLLAQGGFWKNLEKGDLILIFSEDPRVIIWRPSKKLIVNVGPIINEAGGAETIPEPEGNAP
jgi:hypothetical protein